MRTKKLIPLVLGLLLFGLLASAFNPIAFSDHMTKVKDKQKKVNIEMFAPEKRHQVGLGGRGWFVDLEIEFKAPLEATGFSGFQLTGPAGHNNIPPFPGTFSPGADDRLPGLVVLLSTTTIGAGQGQNLANLFNLTGVTDLNQNETELWTTWIVGAPNFGVDTMSTIYVAVVDDLNQDGIYNDAPNVVADADMDGDVDERDLKALGLASNVEKATFYINP